MPRTRFVVLTTQRNGSTWVMSVLNRVEDVRAQGELFLPRPRVPERRWDSDFAHPRYVELAARLGSRRPLSVYRYLREFYGAPGHVGFKLMYSQVRAFPEILPYLMRERIPVIHLVRRNHLDVLISFAVKRRIGQAHILEGAERPAEMTVQLDPATLRADLARLQRKHDVARAVLRACRLRHLEVGYEELVADPAGFAAILRFLDIPFGGSVPESHILKTRVGRQRDVVTNYDEVRNALAGSRFAQLLD